MTDPTKITSVPVEVAHRETIAEGTIVEGPSSESDAINVVVDGFTTDFDYIVPAGNWTPRGSSLPAAGSRCVICFDENGEAWVPIWHGLTVLPDPTAFPLVPIGAIIDYAGLGTPDPGSAFFKLADGSSLLRAGSLLFSKLTQAVNTFTITLASPGVLTTPTAHGLSIGDCVYMTTTGALPTGITAGAAYFVATVPTATTLTLGSTRTLNVAGAPNVGTPVNTSVSQSGVHSLVYMPHGAADATHFNLPDLRDRVAMGLDAAGAHRLGWTGGEETHLLGVGEMPAHAHGVTDPHHNHGLGGAGSSYIGTGTVGALAGGGAANINTFGATDSNPTGISIQNTGGGAAHNVLQPFAPVAKWIRYA